MPQDDAFRRAYDQHVDFVWRLVRGLGVPKAEQEDAVQETFLALHKQLHRLETQDDVKRYLCGIVRHVRSRRWRLDQALVRLARALCDGQFLSQAGINGGSTPERETALKDDLELLQRLLEGLNEKKRDVFVLVDVESFTTDEVAELTGVNPNTVTSRLRAARKHVRRALTRELARDTWRYRWTT